MPTLPYALLARLLYERTIDKVPSEVVRNANNTIVIVQRPEDEDILAQ